MRRSRLASLLGMLVLFALTFAAATWGGAPAQSLTIDPTAWAPSATVGGTPAQQVFTITYSGKGNSGPLGSSISGAGGLVYGMPASLAGCDGVSLSAKKPTCQMTVTFTPTSAATSNATLTVSSRKLTASASLAGTGQAPAPPSLSISDAPWVYSNNQATVIFTVTLSRTSTTAVTFNWTATDDSAYWGSSCDTTADYTSTAQTGSGTIAASQTQTTIEFGTCNDGPAWVYPFKTPIYFTVTISNANGATITNDTGTGTIRIS